MTSKAIGNDSSEKFRLFQKNHFASINYLIILRFHADRQTDGNNFSLFENHGNENRKIYKNFHAFGNDIV